VEPLAAGKRIISPSISSGPDEEELRDARARDVMSPSPEVDLSSPELDFLQEPSDSDPASAQDLGVVSTDVDISHNHRGATPPLESDEREFTETASSMQLRKASEQAELQRQGSQRAMQMSIAVPDVMVQEPSAIPHSEETQERADQHNREAADALFGQTHHLLPVAAFGSSPMMRSVELAPIRAVSPLPKRTFASYEAESMSTDSFDDTFEVWDELQSPENVELDELDNLLGDLN